MEENQNTVQQIFFNIITSGVSHKTTDIDLKNVSIKALTDMVKAHDVATIAAKGLTDIEKKFPEKKELKSLSFLFNVMANTQRLGYNNYRTFAKTIADAWQIIGIRTIAIDSFAFAARYEKPEDCYIEGLTCYPIDAESGENQFKMACEYIKLQKESIDKSGSEATFAYHKLPIRCLARLAADERLEEILKQLLADEGTTPFENSALECPSQMFTVLAMTYRIQQLLLAGNIRFVDICNWAIMLESSRDFDWTRFWGYCDETHLRKYATTMTGVAHTVCGIDIPAGMERDEEAEKLLLEYVMRDAERVGAAAGGNRVSANAGAFARLISVVRHHDRYTAFGDGSIFDNMLKAFAG